jgi:putative membrane protein
MNPISQIAALIGALTYLAVAPVEMFLFSRPRAQRFLHVHADNVDDVHMWAFVVGFRNLLAGVGTIIELVILHVGDETVGRTVVLTASTYMLLASLAMAVADLLGLWRPRGKRDRHDGVEPAATGHSDRVSGLGLILEVRTSGWRSS